MAAAFVQKRWNYAQAVATTTVVGAGQSLAAITNGNTVLVGIFIKSSTVTVSSVTDSAGNTYTADTIRQVASHAGGSFRTIFYRASNVTGSPTSVTVTFSSAIDCCMFVAECSGVTNTSPLGQEFYATGSGTTPSASATTTTDGEISIGFIGQNSTNTFTPGTGWTLDIHDTNNANAMSKVLGTAGSTTMDGTFSAGPNWSVHGVTYKADTGGGGSPALMGQACL